MICCRTTGRSRRSGADLRRHRASNRLDRAGAEPRQREPGRKNDIVGQAYFLRALHYHNLVKLWGGVPLRLTTPASPAEASPDCARTVDEVYTQILADLAQARTLRRRRRVSYDRSHSAPCMRCGVACCCIAGIGPASSPTPIAPPLWATRSSPTSSTLFTADDDERRRSASGLHAGGSARPGLVVPVQGSLRRAV